MAYGFDGNSKLAALRTACTRECPACHASHITATDARVCCPPTAEQLAARTQLPGYGFHTARVWPMHTEPTAIERAAIAEVESAAKRWIAAAQAEHVKSVAKIEALAAAELKVAS